MKGLVSDATFCVARSSYNSPSYSFWKRAQISSYSLLGRTKGCLQISKHKGPVRASTAINRMSITQNNLERAVDRNSLLIVFMGYFMRLENCVIIYNRALETTVVIWMQIERAYVRQKNSYHYVC